jgi:macrolide phosphotransferase
VTKQPTWNIDRKSSVFARSFGQALAALHGVPDAAGLKVSTPEEIRKTASDEIERVRKEVGVGVELDRRWQAWLDDDSWPPFTALIHGDLYGAHVLVDDTSRATGILDWTEAEVADPAMDFVFHLMGFGESGLDQLLTEYEAAGGRTWSGMRRHIGERLSAVPVKYALFALTTASDEHLAAARVQLGAEKP